MKKNFPLRIRRKSFDVEEAKKSHEHGPSGTVGRNLGFWMTAYLGFQTLGSIYGLSTIIYIILIKGDIGTSPLYVYTGFVLQIRVLLIVGFFRIQLGLLQRMSLVPLAVSFGRSLWFPL